MTGSTSPSMKDVAARAGVSLGTVSNVLNRPDQVSERTRGKVHAAIEALGFVRNESARRLRGSRSRTLAYVVFSTTNPFFTDVADGAQAAADAAGLALYLCNSGGDTRRQGRDGAVPERRHVVLEPQLVVRASTRMRTPGRGTMRESARSGERM